MRFLIDAQLPPALVKTLVAAGHEATHVAQLGLVSASDQQIWNRVTRTRSVLVTKDEDFVALRRRLPEGPCVVWLRIGNTTNKTLERKLLPRLAEIVAAVEAGEPIIEVR